MTQTKRDIQAALASVGARPLKRLGQNFLIDGNLMHKLVAAAEVRRDDVVLEVGAGTGGLTDLLAAAARHVVAVELDRALAGFLEQRYVGRSNVTLLHGDALERKSEVAPRIIDALKLQIEDARGSLLLVANLPYNIATPLVMDLLIGELPFRRFCFTVQAEVGDRITASAGGKVYGPISVITQALSRCSRIARIPAQAFWPAPKIESVMLRLDVREEDHLEDDVRTKLVEMVRGCFGHRRKTMKRNLRTLLDEETMRCIEDDDRWKLRERPERWSVDQWQDLAERLVALGKEREAKSQGA